LKNPNFTNNPQFQPVIIVTAEEVKDCKIIVDFDFEATVPTHGVLRRRKPECFFEIHRILENNHTAAVYRSKKADRSINPQWNNVLRKPCFGCWCPYDHL
jgi:hypothetical protein